MQASGNKSSAAKTMKDFIDKYKFIILLFLLSILMQTVIMDKDAALIVGRIVFLFFASFLVSYVAVQFHRKYNKDASHRKWWIGAYIVLLLISIFP